MLPKVDRVYTLSTLVLPILTYCCQARNTNIVGNIQLFEKIQRRFTQRIYEIKHLPYQFRLRELRALIVQHKLLFADIVFVYRCIYSGPDSSQSSLSVVSFRTKGNDVALLQLRTTSKTCSLLFYVRTPSAWNKLSPRMTCCRLLSTFKLLLFEHFMSLHN